MPAPAQARYITGSATAYHACDGSTNITAMGTRPKVGVIANNQLRLGTWVEMVRPGRVMGRRWFRVEDRGGPGFIADFWAQDCRWMGWWGRRTVTFRVLAPNELWMGLPRRGWRWQPS